MFVDFPAYLQTNPTSRRSERATSSARLDNENLELSHSIEAFEESDVICSLDDLKNYFSASSHASNFVLVDDISNDCLVFVKFAHGLPPKII